MHAWNWNAMKIDHEYTRNHDKNFVITVFVYSYCQLLSRKSVESAARKKRSTQVIRHVADEKIPAAIERRTSRRRSTILLCVFDGSAAATDLQ